MKTKIRKKIAAQGSGVRIQIFALFCLTAIAIVSLMKLTDPENIIINVIIAIGSFSAAIGVRKLDELHKKGKG